MNINQYKCKMINKELMFNKIENTIQNLNNIKPHTKCNIGYNKWIVKPSSRSKGQGIKIQQDINDILYHIHSSNNSNIGMSDSNFIVQK